MRGLQDAGKLPSTAPDIADALDKEASSKTVRKRLRELKEKEEATEKDAGRGNVWDLTAEGLEADADLKNQISGLLESAEPEDIPSEQAVWIAESLSADEFSAEKKIEILECIETSQIPDNTINEILESIDPQSIPNEKITAAIEAMDIDVDEIPDGFAERLVTERFGYVVSYWADLVRNGVHSFALSGLLTSFGFLIILLTFQIGPFELPTIAGVSLPPIIIESQIIGSFIVLFGLIFAGVGVVLVVTGIFGHKYTSVKDPRPWREFISRRIDPSVNS